LGIQRSKLNFLKTILPVALIAGTLDAAAAVVLYAKPVNLHTTAGIFRYIASALFGNPAFSAGPFYPIMGLVMHYLIALIWSGLYLMILLRILKPGYVWIKMILFSCTIWIVMNGVVLPTFGLISTHHETWTTLKSYAPILLCVAFPICILLEKNVNLTRD
jgi:hypothetical protein